MTITHLGERRGYFECVCGHLTHTIRFSEWPEEGEPLEIYVSMHLTRDTLWRRLKVAFLYLIQREGRYGGDIEETILHGGDVARLIKWLQECKAAQAREEE